MFYWPIQLKQQDRYIAPRGPNLRWAPRKSVCAYGVDVSLKLPRSSLTVKDKSFNCPRRVSPHTSYFRAAMKRWQHFSLVSRYWHFSGPWFTGPLARMSAHINIVTPYGDHYNPDVSMFNPRVFESSVADLMNDYYADRLSNNGTEQDWFAPVNWQPVSNTPCIAARFDAIGNRKLGYSRTRRYCFLPLSERHLLEVVLRISRNLPFVTSTTEPEDSIDDWISEEPMIELSSRILDSLTVRLTESAKEKQERALEGLSPEERSLTKEFPPLKWTASDH